MGASYFGTPDFMTTPCHRSLPALVWQHLGCLSRLAWTLRSSTRFYTQSTHSSPLPNLMGTTTSLWPSLTVEPAATRYTRYRDSSDQLSAFFVNDHT